MIRLRFGRYALIAGAVTMLTGCGAGREQSALPGVPGNEAAQRAAGGDLLYVAHVEKKETSRYQGVLSVMTFPHGKTVATIALPDFATGTCADTSDDVWVVAEHYAYEYARGGTTPIAKIHITHTGKTTTGCAVDPTTGNLAVLTGFYEGSAPSHIDVWPGAHEGKPVRYPITFSPIACAYDGSGNLFVDGYVGSTVFFELSELPKGSDSTKNIQTKLYEFPGGVQWDGKYLAVFSGPVLYRISVSGSVARVVSKYRPRHVYSGTPLAIADGSMVADSGGNGTNVSLWHYPGGGKATKRLTSLEYAARGLTISAGSSPQHNEAP
ncbi:MAG: hypothetical protein WB810_10480 [Candidatus Cybelea sp.]